MAVTLSCKYAAAAGTPEPESCFQHSAWNKGQQRPPCPEEVEAAAQTAFPLRGTCRCARWQGPPAGPVLQTNESLLAVNQPDGARRHPKKCQIVLSPEIRLPEQMRAGEESGDKRSGSGYQAAQTSRIPNVRDSRLFICLRCEDQSLKTQHLTALLKNLSRSTWIMSDDFSPCKARQERWTSQGPILPPHQVTSPKGRDVLFTPLLGVNIKSKRLISEYYLV